MNILNFVQQLITVAQGPTKGQKNDFRILPLVNKMASDCKAGEALATDLRFSFA